MRTEEEIKEEIRNKDGILSNTKEIFEERIRASIEKEILLWVLKQEE